ncbi:PREDICTED: uncharacterized protein LOC106821547 [Priapulus caudatus]|uniref:RNA-directed DNA polymerase n=1 Tax=Priapulus caudatus TaxID=37621 RepID=A0ABM1FBT0_PRICU|nr:PREDICTED: uncharacterized protein LOC106821547 [Priapulus caudatus]
MKTQLSEALQRLQRMLLRIQPYVVTITWRPGPKVMYADYLSRICPSQGPEIELERTIHLVQITNNQLSKPHEATTSDAGLSALREQVMIGWPAEARLMLKLIRSYWSMRDYISVEDGVLYTVNRIIIPASMQPEFLERIHAGHQGITKSQLRAKESVYWLNMSDIEKSCNDCLT